MSLRLIRLERLFTEIKRLDVQMSMTDSDMFEYFATLEQERIEEVIKMFWTKEEIDHAREVVYN